MPSRSWLQRIARGLRWAILGRPARRAIGKLDKPRRLYIEATVTSAQLFHDALGAPAAWVRIDLLEQIYGPLGRAGFELSQLGKSAADSDRQREYRTLLTIVRGAALTLETAHGEMLTLREDTFKCRPPEKVPLELPLLPPELRGKWPGVERDRRIARQAIIQQGDLVRFEALFTPERHPRPGSTYRDDVEVRYRVDGGKRPIELLVVPPEDR